MRHMRRATMVMAVFACLAALAVAAVRARPK
jgi:hypothetical protein